VAASWSEAGSSWRNDFYCMKIRGLTIGAGEWKPLAEEMAERNSRLFGLDWEVVSKPPVPGVAKWNPSWWKLWAFELCPDADAVMVLDADAYVRRPWPLDKADGTIWAVLDQPIREVHVNECSLYGLDPFRYINGGAWFIGRADAVVLQTARLRGPRYGAWLEQTALNQAIQKLDAPLSLLPRTYNWLAHGVPAAVPKDAAVAHFCAMGWRARPKWGVD
jgi:hypothetical protein